MAKTTKRIVLTGALLAVGALGALGALLPVLAESVVPREIRIVARQMSFYIDDSSTANPVIRVGAGERVRVTVVNEDAGFDHDFAVPAWSWATRLIVGAGTTSVVFDAPLRPGTTPYVCSRHAAMMTGTIEVVAGDPAATPTAR